MEVGIKDQCCDVGAVKNPPQLSGLRALLVHRLSGGVQVANCSLQGLARGFELFLEVSNPCSVARGLIRSSGPDSGATRWQFPRQVSVLARLPGVSLFGCGRASPACRTLRPVIVPLS